MVVCCCACVCFRTAPVSPTLRHSLDTMKPSLWLHPAALLGCTSIIDPPKSDKSQHDLLLAISSLVRVCKRAAGVVGKVGAEKGGGGGCRLMWRCSEWTTPSLTPSPNNLPKRVSCQTRSPRRDTRPRVLSEWPSVVVVSLSCWARGQTTLLPPTPTRCTRAVPQFRLTE